MKIILLKTVPTLYTKKNNLMVSTGLFNKPF